MTHDKEKVPLHHADGDLTGPPPVVTAGVLSDEVIRNALNSGNIIIVPFSEMQLNPTGYDVTLGDEVAIYDEWVLTENDFKGWVEDGSYFRPTHNTLDSRKVPQERKFKIDPRKGWVLRPGIGYLMHTREVIQTSGRYKAVLGPAGHLFMQVCTTTSHGDLGRAGQCVFEVQVTHPVRVYPGTCVGQVRFYTVVGRS